MTDELQEIKENLIYRDFTLCHTQGDDMVGQAVDGLHPAFAVHSVVKDEQVMEE